MDYKLLIIPIVIIVLGIIFMMIMSARGKKAGGKAQDRMKEFAIQEYPCLKGASFSVVNLLEDAINAQHIWVVAYDKEGMRLIPATSNPFSQTLTKYEATTFFDVKKYLAANLFVGNKTEDSEYIPYSAITNATVDEKHQKVILHIGNIKKCFKYQTKDCFGTPQGETLNAFFQYLKNI